MAARPSAPRSAISRRSAPPKPRARWRAPPCANPDGRLRPGLFVTGKLVLSEKQAPLVVKLSALQTLENRNVVFVREGEKFEPRDVELGDKDGEQAEVLFGLDEGDVYAARNSFVIKAEIGKASAAHEH